MSYDEFSELYDKRFRPESESTLAESMFNCAKQMHNEPIPNFANRLASLYHRAFGQPTETESKRIREKQLINGFCKGLYNDKISLHVQRTKPKTFEEAQQAAEDEKAIHDQTKYWQVPPAQMTKLGASAPWQQVGTAGTKAGGEPMEIAQIAQMSLRPNPKFNFASSGGGAGKTQAGNASSRGDKEAKSLCFNCGRVGHYKRNCKVKRVIASLTNNAQSGGTRRPLTKEQRARVLARLRSAIQTLGDNAGGNMDAREAAYSAQRLAATIQQLEDGGDSDLCGDGTTDEVILTHEEAHDLAALEAACNGWLEVDSDGDEADDDEPSAPSFQ